MTFQTGNLNPRFSVIFPPMIWIFMESEEPGIKSKQASKRDRTLKGSYKISHGYKICQVWMFCHLKSELFWQNVWPGILYWIYYSRLLQAKLINGQTLIFDRIWLPYLSRSHYTHYLGITCYVNFVGCLGNNGFQLKWRFGTHDNWKNQNPVNSFGVIS